MSNNDWVSRESHSIRKDVPVASLTAENGLYPPVGAALPSSAVEGALYYGDSPADSGKALFYRDAVGWVVIDGVTVAPPTSPSITSTGTGLAVLSDGTAPTFAVKSLQAGSGVTITPSGPNSYAINSNYPGNTNITALSQGGLVEFGYPDITIRSLAAGNNISITSTSTDVTIAYNGPSPEELSGTLTSNVVAGGNVFTVGTPQVGPNFNMKSLTVNSSGGRLVGTILPSGNFQITSTPAGQTGITTTGAGTTLIFSGNAPNFSIKSLAGTTNLIDVTNTSATTVTVSTPLNFASSAVGGGAASMVADSSTATSWRTKRINFGPGVYLVNGSFPVVSPTRIHTQTVQSAPFTNYKASVAVITNSPTSPITMSYTYDSSNSVVVRVERRPELAANILVAPIYLDLTIGRAQGQGKTLFITMSFPGTWITQSAGLSGKYKLPHANLAQLNASGTAYAIGSRPDVPLTATPVSFIFAPTQGAYGNFRMFTNFSQASDVYKLTLKW